ncbi:MAG: bifunctional diaminohydroxyphosphoribosylaminopyrimidine deaminase/5-amino-6-(5-phosphoribosylamino)uracil reductase RibD [Nitrospinota bacterium]|nr:bifunctional diaminohydroxyphosphoribosylaminopyrimidine deaminase/5-amino-6-(5-phosphoribosylamino)uracil reductase RibD [Nitrospinota bacterium]
MSRWSEVDRAHMREALDLAGRPGWRTHPNPMVGAVVVKNGRVVGRGFHRRPGGPHAEIRSLRDAGRRASGATLYVTLEPCCHHGRTPPCTDAVIGAGVSRVVAAMRDPNPKVAGRGLRILRRNRIQVETGLLGDAARRLNEAFCRRVEENRPWVILKSAISLDGKIATASGDSKWITSAASRAHVHRLRDGVDAILAGIGAVLADDPRLTARPAGRIGRDPIRVILDSALRIPLKAKALNRSSPAGIIVATTARAEAPRVRALRDRGVDVWVLPARRGRVGLGSLLKKLAACEITTLLVEGGGEVAGSFLREGWVDRAAFYVAPVLIGGENAPGPLRGAGTHRLSGAWNLEEAAVTPVGPDLLIEGYVRSRKQTTRRRSRG